MLTNNMTAKEVLAAHWDGLLPVRPVAIAHSMGVAVFTQSGMDVSGWVGLDANGQPQIVYNADEPESRQRFTIAHELGHFASGHLSGRERMLRDPRENFFSSSRSPWEVQANRFAAGLLMPEDALRLAVSAGMGSISQLARLFRVSEVAMEYRLINLGIIHG